MRIVLFLMLFLGVAALTLLSGSRSEARTYPWCAFYDWSTYNCGFTSYRQCLAAISGVGGDCRRNAQSPEQEPGRRSKRPPQHSGEAAPAYGMVPRAGEPARMIQLPNGRWISSYGCVFDQGNGRYSDCSSGRPD